MHLAEHLALSDEEDRAVPALCLGLTLYGAAVMIVDGQVDRQDDGYGMDFPHLVLSQEGPLCPCGDRGCAQMYVLAPGIRRLAAEQGLVLDTDEPVSEVCQRAESGDAGAESVLEEVGAVLGLLVRALRGRLGLGEADRLMILYPDSHRGTFALHMPIATHAMAYLAQRSSHYDEDACIAGAALLEP